ncbi:hypothetical protein BC567DRAFT_236224 [Phyllosticta citribraziliensis]
MPASPLPPSLPFPRLLCVVRPRFFYVEPAAAKVQVEEKRAAAIPFPSKFVNPTHPTSLPSLQ